MKAFTEVLNDFTLYEGQKWDVHATFANGVIQTKFVFSNSNLGIGENEYTNVSYDIDVESLRPQFEDFSAFAILFDTKFMTNVLSEKDIVKTCTLVNLFKLTCPSRMDMPAMISVYNKMPYAILLVPYANSTTDEMFLVTLSPKNNNDSAVYEGFNEVLSSTNSAKYDSLDGWLKHMPFIAAPKNITATPNQPTPFSVQLIDSNGVAIKRSGVTIYLDNTGGMLANTRIITDANGLATGYIEVKDTTPMRIRLGYKYVYGIVDIFVN